MNWSIDISRKMNHISFTVNGKDLYNRLEKEITQISTT